MAFFEKELGVQLKDAGTKLFTPPSSVQELLSLLDRLEYQLSMVKQSPSELLKTALLPSTKALIAKEILQHSDEDVRVSVASCISQIMRISAPHAPYDEDQMKEYFNLTVVAFGKLSDASSHCYSKAVSILCTAAKVKSCILMLDLNCDALVMEMFRHFLKAIRSNHSHDVFKNMEVIMTTVLEESDDISWELLCPLLESVKKKNQNVSPMSWKLAESVIKNCASKLQPYLVEAVQCTGIVLNGNGQKVASICKNGSDIVEPIKVDGFGEHLASEMLHGVNNLGEQLNQLIGRRIKVWWPKDKRFYGGVVDSFDGTTKKHRVLYSDGDEERLNLKKERWELIGDNESSDDDEEQANLSSSDT